MKILLWHVHGSWTDAFVQGGHDYFLPVSPAGGPWGLGRAGRNWPASVREVALEDLQEQDFDLVVLQRPEEIAECENLTGRRPGRDVPAAYVEHNTPKGAVPNSLHPLADQQDIPIVHVTHFNSLVWDGGNARSTVVEHGIPDPGHLYTGELASLGVVINEPARRWRVTGTDLLPHFAQAAPLDLFGMGGNGAGDATGLSPEQLRVHGDLPTEQLHAELARCRAYLHPMRWTSLGLSLLEAMHLGMPVIALAATEASRAVPPEAGTISTSIEELRQAAGELIKNPEEARTQGTAARRFVLEHYSLNRFLLAWNEILEDERGRFAARKDRMSLLNGRRSR